MNAHLHDHDAAHRPVHGSDDERIVPGTAMWTAHYPEHLQRYEFVAARMVPDASVLDAGCGVGYGSSMLAGLGAGRVVAVDIAEEALAVARAQFSRPNIQWIHEDCQSLPLAGTHGPFDLVVNLENIEHLNDPEAFLERVLRLVKPGGVFVVSTPDKAGVARLRGLPVELAPVNPHHTREFTGEEFRALLERYFERVELAWQTFDPIDRMVYEPVLSALWHNPAARFGRWLQRVLRHRPEPSLESLLPARRYQILPNDPGPGLTITVLAVCRGPRIQKS